MQSYLPFDIEQPGPARHLGRVWVLRVATVLLFCLLATRLWVLQIVRYVDHERQASRNRVRYEPTEPPRGGIYDQRRKLLAGNRIAQRVSLLDLARAGERLANAAGGEPNEPLGLGPQAASILAEMPHPSLEVQLAELARLLVLKPTEAARIRAELANPRRPKFTPVVVKDDLSLAEQTRVEEHLWELPSAVVERIPFRYYPEGAVTAHVMGYVGSIAPDELAARRAEQDARIRELQIEIDLLRQRFKEQPVAKLATMIERLAILKRLRQYTASIVGKTGVEATCERDLSGKPGIRTWQVNARNEPVQILSSTTGQAGESVVLNLDLELQQVAAQTLRGKRGAAVAIDPRNGAVLALYGSPAYDNNLFVPKISTKDWRGILNDPAHPLQNRAIRNAYPPGSTFKMISSLAGLKSGVIARGTSVSCAGGMRVGNMFKKCWSTHGGGIDLTRAIALSCDTFFYRAALRMGPQPILDMAREFGLGARTGIDLPNENSGRVPTLAWHQTHHGRDWYPGDSANIAIGQGDILTTPLQMCLAAATVANGGTVFRPQIVREVRSRDLRDVIRPWQPKIERRLDATPAAVQRVRGGMRAAVVSGTCRSAEIPGVGVAAKTGSAEDPPRRLPHAWFVCFAPYDQPTIAIAVIVENSGHGSSFAAPVAKALLAHYFHLKEPRS